MRPFALILALASTAAAAESAPLAVTEPAVVAPECVRDGATVQTTPAVAFGRRVYLVAWSDGSRMLGRETADIYCARVEPVTGRTLDPKGIAVCRAANLQGRPAVAFDGTNFLVVWQDLRSGTDYDLYAARVTEDGKVLDPDGFPVVRRSSNQAWPAVAFADGRYVVVWMDARQYPVYGLYVARIAPDGKVLDGDGLPLDVEDAEKIARKRPPRETWLGEAYYWWHDLASRATPAIASNGRECLVVYQREYPFAGSGRPGLAAALVRPADGSVAPPVLKVAGGPSPAWTGRGWVLGGPVWKEGWTPTPLLGAAALAADASAPPEETATVDVVAALGGDYNVGKGSTASFPSSAAFCAGRAIVAMQYAWRAKDKRPVFAILVERLSVGETMKVLDARPVVVVSASSPACVNRPVLAAGPNGECLLAYEADTDAARCRIVVHVLTDR